jgi:hypothetical protein
VVDKAAPSLGKDVNGNGTLEFGGLGGIARSGIDRFNSQCVSGHAAVFAEEGESVESIAQKVAHEAGHLFGFRHVFPISPSADVQAYLNGSSPTCTDQVQVYSPMQSTVMDTALNETPSAFANCSPLGCAVVEPANCDAKATGQGHNPQNHYLRYVLGFDNVAGLAPPGSWDLPGEPLRLILIRFVFIDTGTPPTGFNPLETVLYDVRISVVDSSGCTTEAVIKIFEMITLQELQEYQFLIPETSALRLVASKAADGPTDVVAAVVPDSIWDPLDAETFPPDSMIHFPPSGDTSQTVSLTTVLVSVVDEQVEYAFDDVKNGTSQAVPLYEVTAEGTFEISTGDLLENGPKLTQPIDPGSGSAGSSSTTLVVSGSAGGGLITLDVLGTPVQVLTMEGQSAEQVAQALSVAILAEPALTGITALVTGMTLVVSAAAVSLSHDDSRIGLAVESAALNLDTDGDGLLDAVEDGGPNGGDANADSIADSQQRYVASQRGLDGSDSVTVEVSGACAAVNVVRVISETEAGTPDFGFDYPLGLVRFKLPCASANLKLYFHGAPAAFDSYRKYGPTTPGIPSTNTWYDLPGAIFGTQDIGGSLVTTVSFELQDGDGQIFDPGGPSTRVAPQAVPSLSPAGLAALVALLAGASLRLLARSRKRWVPEW